ncbi:MAG: hypothetical protein ACFFDW_17250 [Candidatus Thorarchaeota archaeon]
MSSISTKTKIGNRALTFWDSEHIWQERNNEHDIIKIKEFLEQEYQLIPQK